MTTTDSPRRLRGARPVPREVFGNFFTPNPRTIEQSIHTAICRLDDGAIKALTPDDVGPFSQSRAVLALLTQCYARQIYGSHDIAEIARRDSDFSRLNASGALDANALRRFRSENREPIHHCLVAALHFQVERRVSTGALTKLSDKQLAEEANRRIIMAAFLDSMELDGAQAADPPVEISYLFAKNPSRVH